MGTVEETVRRSIERAVGRECRSRCAVVKGELRELKEQVARLGAVVRELQQGSGKPPGRVAVMTGLEGVDENEVRRARLTPGAIKRIRARLGLTQVQLAALLGVTGPAVAQWESGTSAPRKENRAALVTLRKLGRRDVRRMLGSRG